MTVSELIAKLQEMPHDLLVYGHDGEEGPYLATDAYIATVGDAEQEEYADTRGIRCKRYIPGTYRKFKAVVVA